MKLYDNQKAAIERLTSGKVLLAGTGVGKSITALMYWKTKEQPLKLYIITTARKRDTMEWESEFAKCGIDISEVVVDSWNNIEKHSKVTNAFFIFDEQRAVGAGKWAKTFVKIAKANRWIMLTATPGDCWSDYIPLFLANGFYKNRSDFNAQHVVFDRYAKFPKISYYVNVKKLVYLKKQIVVEMEKVRFADKESIDIRVAYDKEKYRKVKKDRWNIFKDEPIVSASDWCACLRKVCNMSEEKLARLLEIQKKHKKLILFYNFDYELEVLKAFLEKSEVCYAEYNGHKHNPIPCTDEWIYLVQYTAGAEGWNCISTDTIVFYSKNYSYKAMVQAMGRIDRLNTPFEKLYYYYLTTGSDIDRAIDSVLEDKHDFNANKWCESELKS